MRKLVAFGAVAISSALILAGLGTNCRAADPGVTDTEVVIGGHTQESGRSAADASLPKVMHAYFDEVNKAGGVHGRKIKYLNMDCMGVPAKAIEVTRTLVEENKIFAMLGAQSSAHFVVYKYLMENNVPDLLFAESTNEYFKPVKKSVFQGGYSNDDEGSAMGRYVASHLKGKKVCYIASSSVSGNELVSAAKKAIDDSNAKAKESDKVVNGTAAFLDRMATTSNAEVLKLKSDKCDAVMLFQSGASAQQAINFAKEQNMKPVWLTNWPNISTNFLELIDKEVADGIVGATHYATAAGMGADYKKYLAFLKKHGFTDNGATNQRGYYYAETFVEALRRAGKDLTREKLIAVMDGLNDWKCTVCTQPLTFSPTNHKAWAKPLFVKSKGGKWVPEKD